jgi:hypothetical protein
VVAIIVAALVVALFAFGMLARSFETPQQRVARLMREASGTQPVHQAWMPSQRRLDDAMREQFRKLIQTNRDYTEQVKKADISEVKRINSPESFADPDYAAPGLLQLHALYDIDAGQEQKVKEIMDNLRHILENETSGSDREAALAGFDSAVASQQSTRQQAVASEKGWVDAVDEEYAYAAQNHFLFQLRNGHLLISDNGARDQFNTLVRAQEEKRKAFLQAQDQFRKFQQQQLQKLGVAPKDVGQ